MEDLGPSRTALLTAYARGFHQIADSPTILTDPLAIPILGVTPDELAELSAAADDPVAAVMCDRDRRLFFAARARFAEESVAAAVASGARQVVVLGAGLDTFAYRHRFEDLRVFEVDHPDTQAWKRQRLDAAGIDHPSTVTLVPVDFETHSLADELRSSGFDRAAPTTFVWLGVVYYLTPAAIRTTLDYVAGQSAPVGVVFDYLQPASNDRERAEQRLRADRLANAGEPLLTYYTQHEIARQLSDVGFIDVVDHAARDLVVDYLGAGTALVDEPMNAVRASRILLARR